MIIWVIIIVVPILVVLVVVPASITLLSGMIGVIRGVPNYGMLANEDVALLRSVVPPVVWARMIVSPVNETATVPIEIAAEPGADDITGAEDDIWRAGGSFVINLGGLVVRHINIAGAHRDNFDVAVVVDDLLLRGGLEVA